MTARYEIIEGDAIEVMRDMEAGSMDLVLTDPPYGITSCKWDSIIPLQPLWKELKRILSAAGIVAMTASQPFTSVLVTSNLPMFRHEWIWIKNRGSNFANTGREPMKEHESIVIFSRGKWAYNKQMQERTGAGGDRVEYKLNQRTKSKNYSNFEGRENTTQGNLRVPSSWQKFNTETGLHPTQKPVALMEYFIKTYSNVGDTVLDFAAGSGSTGVAAINLGRRFTGIEISPEYCDMARRRIADAMPLFAEEKK